jgi:hypothetical protein
MLVDTVGDLWLFSAVFMSEKPVDEVNYSLK